MKSLIILTAILTLSSIGFAEELDFYETVGLSVEVVNSQGQHKPAVKVENLDYTQANHPLPIIMGKKINDAEAIDLRGPSSDSGESGI